MKVIRMGAVQVGGVTIGKPSPAGTWAPSFDNQTVDFDRDAFTRMLADKGYSVQWEKAMWCPNRSNDEKTRQHDINCTICDGSGFFYYASEITPMLMTGISMQQAFHAYGRWDPGQMMVTALPEKRINYWDRLTLQNGTVRFFEMVTRQRNVTSDVFKFAPLEIEAVTWKARDGSLRSYIAGQDFQVSVLGTGITWLITTGRPDGDSTYSVAYTCRPRYVVQDLVHHHRDSTVEGVHYEFPTQAVARFAFLIRDESKDAAQVQYQDPFKQ